MLIRFLNYSDGCLKEPYSDLKIVKPHAVYRKELLKKTI